MRLQCLQALEYLKQLNDICENLKAKSIDKRLTELNFIDRTSKLFSPITKAVEKQTKNINSDVLKKSINSSSSVSAIKSLSILAPPLQGLSNNSFFKGVYRTDEGTFYGIKGSPQLIVKKIGNDNFVQTIKSDGTYGNEIPLTKGLHTLLFDSEDKIDNKGIKIEDIITRDEIYKDIEVKPGSSRRAKNIDNYKNYLLSNQQSKTGKGLALERALRLQSKALKRSSVLSSAYKAGHTNVLQEMTEILDDQ